MLSLDVGPAALILFTLGSQQVTVYDASLQRQPCLVEYTPLDTTDSVCLTASLSNGTLESPPYAPWYCAGKAQDWLLVTGHDVFALDWPDNQLGADVCSLVLSPGEPLERVNVYLVLFVLLSPFLVFRLAHKCQRHAVAGVPVPPRHAYRPAPKHPYSQGSHLRRQITTIIRRRRQPPGHYEMLGPARQEMV